MVSLYGLVVGLALVLAAWVGERVLRENLSGKQKIGRSLDWLLVFLFIFGVIGARAYHVATDWELYQASSWLEWLAVWRGGLGILGALVGGFFGLLAWRAIFRPPWSLGKILDAAAIALPFGQAVGRWGNFFNHELYGRPTRSGWGVFIPPEYRVPEFAEVAFYHPLFLYESMSLLLAGLGLFALYRFSRQRKIEIFALGQGWFVGLYLLAYGSIRFWLEFLRIDSTMGWYGLSIAQWISMGCVFFGLSCLGRSARKLVLTLGMLVWGFLSFSQMARAQQKYQFDLSVSPSVVEIAVKPGTLVTQAFLLENAGTYDLEVTPVLRDFTADDQSGFPTLQEHSRFPYARLQNTEQQLDAPFILPADGSQQLVLGINIPEDAVERDWYFSLLVQTRALGLGEQTTGAESRGSVAAHVLVRVTSTNSPSLRWKVWLQSLPRFFDSLQSVPFHLLVENMSSTFAAPQVSVVILDWKGNIVSEQEGLPDRILAGATREIFAARQRKDDPRSSEAAPFIFDPLFAFGPYTVRVSLRNAVDGPLVLEEQMWAFPFSIILAITTVLIVGLGLQRWRKNKRID